MGAIGFRYDDLCDSWLHIENFQRINGKKKKQLTVLAPLKNRSLEDLLEIFKLGERDILWRILEGRLKASIGLEAHSEYS